MATLFKNFLAVDGEMAEGATVSPRRGRQNNGRRGQAGGCPATRWSTASGGWRSFPVRERAHSCRDVAAAGIGERPLMEWLQKKIWPAEANLTREHIYWEPWRRCLKWRPMDHCVCGYVLRDGRGGGGVARRNMRGLQGYRGRRAGEV